VAHRKNSNPDTEALGLDVDALVGRTIDEIRKLLAVHSDVALIVGHEPVPEGWPREIVKSDDAADGLCWSYRTADGLWKEILVFGPAQKSPSDPIAAQIYSRSPVDASVASVRPIVLLLFQTDGSCSEASATTAEDRMILAAKEAERSREPQPNRPKRLRRLSAFSEGSPIESLESLMGLPRPEFAVDAEDFITESDGRLVLGVAPSPQPLFVVYDAGQNPRLMAFVEPDQPPKLRILSDAAEWPPIEIGAGGLRVLPRCGMESDEAVLDFFAVGETGHRVIDPTGATRAVKILMLAGPCISSTFPNAKVAVRVVVLASPEAGPASIEKPGPRDLVVRADAQFAQVHAPESKVVVLMKTTIRAEPGAYFVDGVVTRG